MSELLETVKRMEQRQIQQSEEIKALQMMLLKKQVSAEWLDEGTAAASLGIGVRSFRKKVTGMEGLFSRIIYRHTNGRRYQYNRKSLEAFKQITSTQPK